MYKSVKAVLNLWRTMSKDCVRLSGQVIRVAVYIKNMGTTPYLSTVLHYFVTHVYSQAIKNIRRGGMEFLHSFHTTYYYQNQIKFKGIS